MAQSRVHIVDADENPTFLLEKGDVVPVTGSSIFVASSTFTRPANTTQYAAGDVVGPLAAPALLSLAVPVSGYIVGVALIDDVNAATLIQPEVWFWDASPGGIAADNSPFVAEDISMRNWLDTVALSISYVGGATAGSGQSTCFRTNNLNIAFSAPTGWLYAAIVTRNTYTPASLEGFTLRVWIQPS